VSTYNINIRTDTTIILKKGQTVLEGKEEAEAVDTKSSSSNEEKWIEIKFSLLPFEELRMLCVAGNPREMHCSFCMKVHLNYLLAGVEERTMEAS
jgi:hypothetical protein